MKRIITLLFVLVNLNYSMAGPIDIEIAKKVANNFMNSRRSSSKVLNIVSEYYNNEISFYVINFAGGGWVMVSSDDLTVPILGFGLEGEYRLEDSKPDGFVALTHGYKEQIQNSRKMNQKNSDVTKKWDNLLKNAFDDSKSSKSLVGGLLNVPGRGQVRWSQSVNNSGGCTPAYNTFSFSGSGTGCDCDRKDVGCGAVAMGQIMWYYQWPLSSLFRTYNWNNMPNEVTNNTATSLGDEVAHLLADLGMASNFTYFCKGTFPIGGSNYIVDGFNTFGYSGVKKQVRTQWNYGTAWADLIRSEINNNRPVFYRGDKSLTDKHFWVIDGYDSSDPDYFYCNFGWGYPGNDYNISYQYLDDITPGDHEYNENQQLISGISPTTQSSIPWDITGVPYTAVYTTVVEVAENTISLPASGQTLSVESGGDLTLIGGNMITLSPGFEVKAGGRFNATIDPNYTGTILDITVPGWTNVFTPNGDGINDNLAYEVENADSWEFEAFDPYGNPIFQSAGSISETTATVWDGTGALYSHEYYPCIIRFKNGYGRAIEEAYMVYVAFLSRSSNASDDISLIKTQDLDATSTDDIINMNYTTSEDKDSRIEIYPNPNQGSFIIRSLDNSIQRIKIYDASGMLIYDKRNIIQHEISINLEDKNKGIYHIHVYQNNQKMIAKKIIKNR